MKKKLFLLLLIVALAAFVFTGCTPPAEGEGEGEGEIEGVVVEIDGQYEEDGRIYVKGGDRDITVTFPTPVTGVVQVDLTDCTGNYARGPVALFPNADKTVWTGSVDFVCGYTSYGPCDTSCTPVDKQCCATTVTIISGACDRDTCIVFPVIVDCEAPTVDLCVKGECCPCEGIALTFKSTVTKESCYPDEDDCYDDCSGVAGWSLNVYCGYPFDNCCEVPCAEPVFTASGTDCPIDVTTSCMVCKRCSELRYGCEVCCEEGDEVDDCFVEDMTEFYVVFSIWDNVGNTREEGAWICAAESIVDSKCIVTLEFPNVEDDCIEDLLELEQCP